MKREEYSPVTPAQWIIELALPGKSICGDARETFNRLDIDGDSKISAHEFIEYAKNIIVRDHYEELEKHVNHFLRF
jgi:hypothetical protein